MFKKNVSLVLFLISIISTTAYSWGERGHNMVGHGAAVLLSDSLDDADKKLVGDSFRVRIFQLGHLSNIPDFSWKDESKVFFKKLNTTTHHLNPEKILGEPGTDKKAFAAKIKTIETDLSKLTVQYPNFTAGYDLGHKFDLRMDLGTAPWRTQELYDKTVEAFKCAKDKKPLPPGKQHFTDPFTSGSYACTPKTTRNEDLYAAFVYQGLMSHFIGDLSQPMHVTSDFDGWLEGQGGLHNYFETLLLENYDESLLPDIVKRAKEIQSKVWNTLKTDFSKPRPAVQVALNLAADSYIHNDELLELDRKYALVKKGETLSHSQEWGKLPATRKPPSDKLVLKQFRPLVVERITTAVVVLSKLWYQAWVEAGKPDLSEFGYLASPYPMDVPFLKPNFL